MVMAKPQPDVVPPRPPKHLRWRACVGVSSELHRRRRMAHLCALKIRSRPLRPSRDGRHATCDEAGRSMTEAPTTMKRTFRRLVRETEAQDLAEYGIALAVIAAGTGLIAVAIGGTTATLWTRALQAAIA